tara:strand:- start:12280 stop:12963 length:684 start_codon:yes stop_codon:yes gene_type:complete
MVDDMNQYSFDIDRYDFKETVRSFLGVESLEYIHKDESFSYDTTFTRDKDQSTHWHERYYDRSNPFFDLYTKFITHEVSKLYDEPIVYQKIPNIRFHFPGNIAVGEWHRDRQYRDIRWSSRVKELNFYLPLVNAYGTNTIWYETQEGLEDFMPMDCKYGSFCQWDASNLLHGNKKNITSITRVSVDFRVIPESRFEELSSTGSINTKTKFSIGEYYEVCYTPSVVKS